MSDMCCRFYSLMLVCLLCFHLAPSLATQADASRFNTTQRYLYVQPGQTVSSIVKIIYPDEKDHWSEIARRLIIANPHAFEKGNVNKLIVGARVELPPARRAARPIKTNRPEMVGSVIEAVGKAFAVQSDKQRRDIAAGSEVYAGDRVYTGADGFLRIKMIDDARIELRCNSELLIESYKLETDGNTSILHLLKGSLHKVTGKIGKKITDRYEMRTPVATVGVRGTEYSLRVLQSHGCSGSLDVNTDGMFVKVDKGEIDVSNKSGDSTLQPGKALLIANNVSKPLAVKIKDGVFESVRPAPVLPPEVSPVQPETLPVPEDVTVPEQEDDGFNWWWLLGLALLAAL